MQVLGKSAKVAHGHVCSTGINMVCVCYIGCMPLHYSTYKLVADAHCAVVN